MKSPFELVPQTLELSDLWHLLEATTQGLWWWSTNEDRVHWSRRLHETIGTTPDDTEESQFGDINERIHPEDREAHTAAVERARASDGLYRHVARIRRVDGSYIWMRANGLWLRTPEDHGEMLIGFIEDISDTIHAQQALVRGKERFQAFVDHCPAAVFLKDDMGRHLLANKPAAEIAGVTLERLLASSLDDLFDPQTRAALAHVDRMVLREKRVVTWTGEVATGQGEKRIIFDTKFPVPDFESDATLIGGFGVDVTKEFLAEERLQAAQRLESLGGFVGGITHDFKNLLMAINANAELALNHADDVGKQRIQAIMDIAGQASQLCRQLLTFSGGEASAPMLVAPDVFVETSKDLLALTTQNRAILTYDLAGTGAFIHVDPTQLRQILVNLVLNATDARVGTFAHIEISTALAPPPEPRAGTVLHSWLTSTTNDKLFVLRIVDQGRGMSLDVMKRIFEPFFSTRGEGHGLGLAVVIGILRNTYAAVRVSSTEEEGTCFELFWPLVDESTSESALVTGP